MVGTTVEEEELIAEVVTVVQGVVLESMEEDADEETREVVLKMVSVSVLVEGPSLEDGVVVLPALELDREVVTVVPSVEEEAILDLLTAVVEHGVVEEIILEESMLEDEDCLVVAVVYGAVDEDSLTVVVVSVVVEEDFLTVVVVQGVVEETLLDETTLDHVDALLSVVVKMVVNVS